MTESFLERLKKDRTLQFIVVGLVLGFFALIFIFASLFGGGGGQKKQVLPCYNTTLTIWAPLDEYNIAKYFSGFQNRCVRFNYKQVQFKDILKILPRILVQKEVPDIVFVDRFHLLQFRDIFEKAPDYWIKGSLPYLQETEVKWFEPWLGTPFFVDSLVAIYLKDYLKSAGLLKPPETFEELNQYIQKLRVTDQSGNLIFSPIVLGSSREKRLAEIILALASLETKYLDRDNLRKNLPQAIERYLSYADYHNENYSYSNLWPGGEELILNRKTGAILGFYEDVVNLRKKDPRISLTLGKFYRKGNDPRRTNFTQIYYLGVLKTKNAKVAWDFLGWLYSNYLIDLAEEFQLVPATLQKMDKIDSEKKIVLEEAALGETFDFVDLDVFRQNISELIETWRTNPSDGQKLLDKLEPTILPYRPAWLE